MWTSSLSKRMLLLSVLLLVSSFFAQHAAAQKPKKSMEARGHEFVTRPTQQAIDKGLAWLAGRQHEDGSFGSGGNYPQNVAVTALSGMSFIAAGHTPTCGKYASNVKDALKFILERCQPNGYIIDTRSKSHGPMYGHGFATMFLAEVYGTTNKQNKELREKLARAVKLIIAAQNKEGGWRYEPKAKNADISVTVCQMMALRAARNCGISVPKEIVERCVDYVKKCQKSDGGFRYQLLQNADSSFPRSAAGVVALYSAGIYKGREIEKGLKYLRRHRPRGDMFRTTESYYFYGHYYAVQAMWHSGGDDWKQWYSAIRDELLQNQEPSGLWVAPLVCSEYGTAMSLLILQMPNNYLPIFQR